MGFWPQLKLLLWKNFTMKRRQPFVLTLEIFIPLTLFLILAVVRCFQPPTPYDPQRFRAYPLPSAGVLPLIQEMCAFPHSEMDEGGFLTMNKDGILNLLTKMSNIGRSHQYFVLGASPQELEDIPTTISTIVEATTALNNVLGTVPNATISNTFVNASKVSHHLETVFKIPSKSIQAVLNHPLQLTQITPHLYETLGKIFSKRKIHQRDLNYFDEIGKIISILSGYHTDADQTVFHEIKSLLLPTINFHYYLCNGNYSQPSSDDHWEVLVSAVCERRSDEANKLIIYLIENLNYNFLKKIEVLIRLNPMHLKKDLETMMRNIKVLFVFKEFLQRIGSLVSQFPVPESLLNLDCEQKLEESMSLLLNNVLTFVCGDDMNERKVTHEVHKLKSEKKGNLESVNKTAMLVSMLLGKTKILYAPTNSDVDKIMRKVSEALGLTLIETITKYAISCKRIALEMEHYLENNYVKVMEDANRVVTTWHSNRSIVDLFDKERLLKDLKVLVSISSAWLRFASNLKLDLFVGFQDESALLHYFQHQVPIENVTVFAGLIFVMNGDGSLPQHVTYSIRQSASLLPDTKKLSYSHIYKSHITKGQGYYLGGFVFLQDLIDRAIISLHSERDVVEPGNYIQEMPIPCYAEDKLVESLEHSFPMISVMSWVYVVAILVQNIVHEKEHRLKEVMRAMGMSELAHWLSWFLISLFFVTITTALLTIIFIGGRILPNSQMSIIFVIFELYGISTIAISFLFSSMFSKAKVASACAGIGYFLLFVPSVYIGITEIFNNQVLPFWNKAFAFLIAPTVCSRISNYITYHEEMGSGVRWDNWHESPIHKDRFGVRPMVCMLAIDCVLYFILAWYINNVFPGTYGLPRRWYFLFTKSYWAEVLDLSGVVCCNSHRSGWKQVKSDDVAVTINSDTVTAQNPMYFEPDPSHLVCGVCIDKLVKVYGHYEKVAVKDLSLNFYEGQITSFLGHNGAGKTTTLSILTGIFPPTSGTATIYGLDIRKDMVEIRRNLGICPQHNVLFDQLTVEEHILFYAQLKGVLLNDVAEELERIIEDVGLKSKRNTTVDSLAGGMKRKLSVAIAFIGGSRTVILDEPTSGVDPCSRRAIWDLILKYKKGRTIILSTHHMDEAEILSDRIAIVANGKLQSCGSPVFLKNNLGTGYHLYLARNIPLNNGVETTETEKQSKDWEATVTGFVRDHVATAIFVSESTYELHYILPLSELKTGNYEKLFVALDTNKAELGVSSYGVKSATLEEVFLHVSSPRQRTISNGEGSGLSKSNEQTSEQTNWTKKNDSELPANRQQLTRDSIVGRLRNRKNSYQLLPYEDSIENDHQYLEQNELTYNRPNRGTWLLQLCAILRKRYWTTKRNSKNLFSQIILPAIFVAVAMSVALIVPSFEDPPPLILSSTIYDNVTQPRGQFVTVSNVHQDEYGQRKTTDSSSSQLESTLLLPSGLGSSCVLRSNDISSLSETSCGIVQQTTHTTMLTTSSSDRRYHPVCRCEKGMSGFICSGDYSEPPSVQLPTGLTLYNISGHKEMDYLLYTADIYREQRYGALSFGLVRNIVPNHFGVNAPLNIKKVAIRHAAKAWYESTGFHSMPIFVNALNNAILRANLPHHKGNPAAYGITVINHPFPNTNSLAQYEQLLTGTDLIIAVFVITAMAFVPASFVLSLVHERNTKSTHLHMVSGVKPIVYWAGNYIWDLINYLVPATFCLMILLAFNVSAYTEGDNLYAVILLFLLYGWAMTPAMYPFSFHFQEPSVAYVFLVVLNLFMGLTAMTTVVILNADNTNKLLILISDILDNVFLIFPNYCLGKGLMDLAVNDYKNFFYIKMGQLDKIRSPFAWKYIPKKLFVMSICGIVFFYVTLLFERRASSKKEKRKTPLIDRSLTCRDADVDVIAEERRVIQAGNASIDALSLLNLTKVYHTKKLGDHLAVDNVCLGIPHGECFGLLGVNGAGKTTTFRMLTGDVGITSGDAFLNGHSIGHNFKAAKRFMGYCPQFDALYDDLTAREHLQIYSCFHGISGRKQKRVVEYALSKLDLVSYADCLVKTFSGGTKRKLSTALALLGNPAVIFLDEPTTGMDPRSRRFLWDVILDLVSHGQSIVLTSHSMEECEALCNRLTIMVNGRLRCLGSVQHLKSRFGSGYSITVRLKCEQDTSVTQFFAEAFPKAFLKGRHHNILHYELQSSDVSLAHVFACLEAAVQQLPVEDYSVCQNTLDNVFINFVKEQSSEETTEDKDEDYEEAVTTADTKARTTAWISRT